MNKRKMVFVVELLSLFVILLYGTACVYSQVRQSEKIEQGVTDIIVGVFPAYFLTERHENIMPEIADIIISDDKAVVLCKDGSVWSRSTNESDASADKVLGLENIVKILCGGPAMYALSEDGNVYVWGSNEWLQMNPQGDTDRKYVLPVRIAGLSDIKDIGVNAYPEDGRGRCFAIDREGRLYVWGLHLYCDMLRDFAPGFPQRNYELVKNVQRLFIGAGNNHYFVREDGTVFSIMDTVHYSQDMVDFIYPCIEDTDLDDISYVDLNEGAKYALTILYEMGDGKNIELIGADKYTMFLYKKDGTLWYWNSKTVEYHDCKEAVRAPETGVADYQGEWREIDYKGILKSENNDTLRIADICVGAENVLFLTNDGQVFISMYETKEFRDVECYQYSIREWNRVQTIEALPIKTIILKKLDWENAVKINTDGSRCFTAVNEVGKYYYLETDF